MPNHLDHECFDCDCIRHGKQWVCWCVPGGGSLRVKAPDPSIVHAFSNAKENWPDMRASPYLSQGVFTNRLPGKFQEYADFMEKYGSVGRLLPEFRLQFSVATSASSR